MKVPLSPPSTTAGDLGWNGFGSSFGSREFFEKLRHFVKRLWNHFRQGSFNYQFFFGMKQCKSMVILKDFPLILHGLGW